MIAAEIRQAILQDIGLTCCAGIAHNKLLAKLVGAWKKPNKQTTLLPEDAESLLSGLKARDIPGIIREKGTAFQPLTIKTLKISNKRRSEFPTTSPFILFKPLGELTKEVY